MKNPAQTVHRPEPRSPAPGHGTCSHACLRRPACEELFTPSNLTVALERRDAEERHTTTSSRQAACEPGAAARRLRVSAWKLQPSARYLQVPSFHALYLPGVLLPDFLESLISCSLHLCFEIHTLYVQSAILPLREARVTVPQLQVPEAAPFARRRDFLRHLPSRNIQ